jgi:hypothetical protein
MAAVVIGVMADFPPSLNAAAGSLVFSLRYAPIFLLGGWLGNFLLKVTSPISQAKTTT